MTYSNTPDGDSPDDAPDSDFDWLANIYTSHGAINHPSELHGLMIGEMVGNMKRTPGDWLEQVMSHMGVEELNTERQSNLVEDLIELYKVNGEGIDQDSSSFCMLLPDDEYGLPERLDSLAIWVRGFLEGLAISSSEKLAGIGDDLQEILKDLVEICNLDSRVASSEEGEKEYFEISEYVRIGVLNLYAELNEPPESVSKTDSSNSPTLH